MRRASDLFQNIRCGRLAVSDIEPERTLSQSKAEQEYAAYITELMQGLGPVSTRRMFGGYGVFLDGLMFGLIADSTLYLKADDQSAPQFEEKSLEQFTYEKKGKPFRMSYYQAPEEALDNPEDMLDWATTAYDAALRSAAKSKR